MKKRVILTVCISVLVLCASIVLSACNNLERHIKYPDFKSDNVLEGAEVIEEVFRRKDKPTAQRMIDGRSAWTPRDLNRDPADKDGKVPEVDWSSTSLEAWSDNPQYSPHIVVKLNQTSTFNTAYLEEKGDEVLFFRLQAWDSEAKQWVTFYQSEKIERFRICSFDEVTTDMVRFSIDKFRSGKKATINAFKLFNEEGRWSDDFTVAVYQRLDSDVPTEVLAKIKEANLPENADNAEYERWRRYPEYYDVYNTVIVFGAINWDINGNMIYSGVGTPAEREANFTAQIEALHEIIGMRTNPHDVKLIITSLPDGAGGGHNEVNIMMHNHWEKVCAELLAFMQRHDFDGMDIDWEYPQNKNDWALFDKFITRLKTGMREIKPDAVLSGAFSAWQLGMSRDVLAMFDQIQWMAYDGSDRDGFQSYFRQAYEGLTEFIKMGADPAKINIGIAAYGRPKNGAPYWGEWRDVEGDPMALKFNNLHYNVVVDNALMDGYYVSPALAGDKMTYALFAGVGGVMVFRLACDKYPDDPFSIVRGLGDARDRYL